MSLPQSIAPQAGNRDEIIVLEANLDDMTGEAAGYLMGKLLDAGARDVFYTSVQMKKNRPGMLLTVLTDDASLNELETVIFRESSTIGIRRTPASRSVMNRTAVTVEVEGQPVSIKVCEWNGIRKAAPEYEQVRGSRRKGGIAVQNGISDGGSGLRRCFRGRLLTNAATSIKPNAIEKAVAAVERPDAAASFHFSATINCMVRYAVMPGTSGKMAGMQKVRAGALKVRANVSESAPTTTAPRKTCMKPGIPNSGVTSTAAR